MNVLKNIVYSVCYFMEYSINVNWVKLVDSVVTSVMSLLIFFPLVLSNIEKKGIEISNHILDLPGYFCNPKIFLKLCSGMQLIGESLVLLGLAVMIC